MKKFFTLGFLIAMAVLPGMAQSCDTLFNLRSNLDVPTVVPADSINGGYLSGNNEYGDLIKAEAFAVADSGYYITSATFKFGVAVINATDSNTAVTLTVWDNTGISLTGGNAPGSVIDSVQVTLGQIAQAVTAHEGLMVYFTGGVLLTTDTIYVGVTLPALTGDTVALYTNTPPAGPDGNGWEYTLNTDGSGTYVWSSYNNDWFFGGGSLGNYISATICNTPPADTPASGFTMSGPVSSCSPVAINFTDTTVSNPAPSGWTWSFGDGNYSNDQNPVNVYTVGGTYTVTETVTNNNGTVVQVFVAASATVSVLGSPSITATITPDIDSTSVGAAFITITGGTGFSFASWSDGTMGDTLSNALAGLYTVTVLDQNGCYSVDSVLIPSVNGTGIIHLSGDAQVKVYPVPATSVLNLDWSQSVNADVTILDMYGNVLNTISTDGAMTTVCDIHGLAAGTYILRISDRKTNQQQSVSFSKF